MDGETPEEFRARMLSIGVISRRTRDNVVEARLPAGGWTKATTDELGNTVTEHSAPGAPGVSHRQDVLLRPKPVKYKVGPVR